MKPKVIISTNALLHPQRKLGPAYESIFNFAEQCSFRTQMASVVSPDLLSWPAHFDDEWGNEFMRLAKRIASENLKEFEDRSTELSELILQTVNSRKHSVRAIIDFAKTTDAGMIAAITHLPEHLDDPKTHHEKLLSFPGSFVETLVAESQLPVLVVNSQSDPVQKFRKILVPTDFSKAARYDFGNIVQLAKTLNAEILLIHVLTIPEGMTLMEGVGLAGGWPRIEDFMKNVETESKEKSREILLYARNENIKIEFKLIRNRARLSQVILDQALESKSDLIAMTNQTGPIASLILGSVTRQLMRSSQLPVLVFPPLTHDI